MNIPKISEVFHLAADKYLAPDEDTYKKQRAKNYTDPQFRAREAPYSEQYSCCAVYDAITELYPASYGKEEWNKRISFRDMINNGMQNMGLRAGSMHIYDDYPGDFAARQGARYLWLKWCAMIAEEQGV